MGKINWRNHFSQKIVVEEYYIEVRTQHDTLYFKVRYVKHNGFTVLEPTIGWPVLALSGGGNEFLEWLKLRSDLTTRYDLPHWYKPIRFNRKRRLVRWGVTAVDKAYSTWHQEKFNKSA